MPSRPPGRVASASSGSSPDSGAGSPSGSRGTAPLSSTRPTYDDPVTERWIELDGLVNMRDLGGLPTRDGGRTASGRLIRSDNLQDLTDADVHAPRRRARRHRRRRPAHRDRGARRGTRAAAPGRVAHPPPPLAHPGAAPGETTKEVGERALRAVGRAATPAVTRGSGPSTTWATSRAALTRSRRRCGSSPTPRAPPSCTAPRARTAPARSSRWRSTSRACRTRRSSPTTCSPPSGSTRSSGGSCRARPTARRWQDAAARGPAAPRRVDRGDPRGGARGLGRRRRVAARPRLVAGGRRAPARPAHRAGFSLT